MNDLVDMINKPVQISKLSDSQKDFKAGYNDQKMK